jgi:hypothetical protein
MMRVGEYIMWMPPDLGKQYARELERKQLEEAYHREGRTCRPSYLRHTFRLGIGQKLLLLGVALVVVLVLLAITGSLT